MELTINLDETWGHDESVGETIKDEIRQAVRRKVKSLLRDKAGELAKAVEAYAREQAKRLESEMTGAAVL